MEPAHPAMQRPLRCASSARTRTVQLMADSRRKAGIGCLSMFGLCVLSGVVVAALEPTTAPEPASQASVPEQPRTPLERGKRLLAEAHTCASTVDADGDILTWRDKMQDFLRKIDALDAPTREALSVDAKTTIAELTKVLKKIRPVVAMAEKKQAKVKAVTARCGPPPSFGMMDGELIGSESFLRATANDPDSIDVELCTEPEGSESQCWVSTCNVRGKNGSGALVLQRMRFTYANGEVRSARQM